MPERPKLRIIRGRDTWQGLSEERKVLAAELDRISHVQRGLHDRAFLELSLDALEARMAELTEREKALVEREAAVLEKKTAEERAQLDADPMLSEANSAVWQMDEMTRWFAEQRPRLLQRQNGPTEEDASLLEVIERIGRLRSAFGTTQRVERQSFLEALDHVKTTENAEQARHGFTKRWLPSARGHLGLEAFYALDRFDEAIALWRRKAGSRGGVKKWDGLSRILADIGLGHVEAETLEEEWSKRKKE